MENVKNITAEKTELYFEKDEYNKRIGSLGYFVRDYVQPLTDELKTIGVNLTKDLIFEIIDMPQELERYFKNKAKEDSKSFGFNATVLLYSSDAISSFPSFSYILAKHLCP